MRSKLLLAAALTTMTAATASAQWNVSVGVNVGRPAYGWAAPAPIYYGPPTAIFAPEPVFVVMPRPVYVAPVYVMRPGPPGRAWGHYKSKHWKRGGRGPRGRWY
jgi:hypothetical protein